MRDPPPSATLERSPKGRRRLNPQRHSALSCITHVVHLSLKCLSPLIPANEIFYWGHSTHSVPDGSLPIPASKS